MLQSRYLTEHDLKDYGFKKLGNHVRISSDCRVYGAENIEIGDHVRIDDFTILSAVNGNIRLGNYIFIARSCHLSGALGIEMKDFSSMAANTVLYSASDDYTGKSMTAQAIPAKFTTRVGGQIVVGRHVIIGSSVTLLGHCEIGEGCSIGAMSLVNHSLEPWGIYIGVPVKRLRDRSKELLEYERLFMSELEEG